MKRHFLREKAARVLHSLFALLILALISGGAQGAFHMAPHIETYPRSGVEIELGWAMQKHPSSGYSPVHVMIRNDTDSAHEWEFSFSQGAIGQNGPSAEYKEVIQVEPHQTRRTYIYVPRPGLSSYESGYEMMSGRVDGYGVKSGRFMLPSNYSGGGYSTAFVAMSTSLADVSWSLLETQLRGTTSVNDRTDLSKTRIRYGARGSSRGLMGSPIDLRNMPGDAKGFAGIAGLWLQSSEWRALPADRRNAIYQWVLQGGKLFVAHPEAKPESLPMLDFSAPDWTGRIGFGRVETVRLENGKLPVPETAVAIVSLDDRPLPAWRSDFENAWALPESLGWPRLNVAFIVIFVCVFALIIGPVNLLVLAPAAKRHRLFFTVPVLSLAASAVLFGAILIGDGVGGAGARNVIVYLPAGDNRAIVVQEQAARSRLLLGRDFALPLSVEMSSILLNQEKGSGGTLRRNPVSASGDWFASREMQMHFLRTTLPSRAGIAVRAGGGEEAPSLISSVPGTLRQIFYMDPEERFWFAPELHTGQPTKMAPATRKAYDEFMQQQAASFSTSLRVLSQELAAEAGHVYAIGEATDQIPIATLPAISWRQQTVLYVAQASGPAKP